MATVQVDFNEYQLLVQQTEEIKQLKYKLSQHESEKNEIRINYEKSLDDLEVNYYKKLDAERKKVFKTTTVHYENRIFNLDKVHIFDELLHYINLVLSNKILFNRNNFKIYIEKLVFNQDFIEQPDYTTISTFNLDEITEDLCKDLREEYVGDIEKLKAKIANLEEVKNSLIKELTDFEDLKLKCKEKIKEVDRLTNHIQDLEFKYKEQSEYLETLSGLIEYKEKFEIIIELLKEGYGLFDSQSKLTKIYKILTEK